MADKPTTARTKNLATAAAMSAALGLGAVGATVATPEPTTTVCPEPPPTRPPSSAPCFIARHERTIDGDTFVADVELGLGVVLEDQRIRVLGIDTPELRTRDADEKRRGIEASEMAHQFLTTCEVGLRVCTSRRDNFGRLLGDARCGALDLADELVAAGHAKPYTR